MNALNFADLLHEHAYLSESLADTRRRMARLEEVFEKKVTSAKARGRKPNSLHKTKKALRQCRQDEHTLISTLAECVNKIEGLKRHQLAVEQTQTAFSWSIPQQEQWAGESSSDTGPRWSSGWYTGALPPVSTTAPLAQMPLQNYLMTPHLLVFPCSDDDGHRTALVNSIVVRAPYELTLPGYAAPPSYGTSSFSPALNPSAPEFKYDDARSDGLASLSLSVDPEDALTDASVKANEEPDEPLGASEAGSTEHDSQVVTALRSMDATQPAFHRNNKPAPLVHPSIIRMKSSAMRSPEELISPKTVPQHRRRYSEDTIDRIESRLKTPRKVTFAESPFKGFAYEPEPDTPMKGHKRGAKSELPRAWKKVGEDMWDDSGSGQVYAMNGMSGQYSGNGNLEMVHTAPGDECTGDEGQYVGYGIVWNWEDGGAVWPKTPLAVRVHE